MQARSVAVYGSALLAVVSARRLHPELTGIALACEASQMDQDLTILTDSLSSMCLLKTIDFPLWLSSSSL